MSVQATNLDSRQDKSKPVEARPRKPRSQRRLEALKWLRKVHGWVGLWGGAFGLLYGLTGILQNHRETLQIRIKEPPVITMHLPLASQPGSPADLASYVQQALKLVRPAERMKVEPAMPVRWGDQSVIQPEHWTIRFNSPDYLATADYFKGGTFVDVERHDHGVLATLKGLHGSNGASVGWILFADTIGGSMIVLSLTGLVLWTELNRRRVIGAGILMSALIVAFVLACETM